MQAASNDIFEVREVSSSTNMIAGDSLASFPLLGSVAHPNLPTLVNADARFSIPLDITSMTRGSTVTLLVHSQKQRVNTAPTLNETMVVYTRAATSFQQPSLDFIDATTAQTTPAVTTAVSVTGLTTTQDDDLIVAMVAGGQEAAWSAFNATTPSGASGATDTTTAPSPTAWTERADSMTVTGADTSLAIFDAVKTAAGATGNLTATASIGGGNVVIAGAFKIAAAAGGGISVPVTGVSATGSTGSVTVATVASIAVPVTGVEATGQVGDVSVAIRIPVSVPVTGVLATGAVDAVTIVGKANVSTTGVAASGAVGGVTTTGKANAPVTGVEAVGSIGNVSAVVKATPLVTGVEATGQIGAITIIGKANAPVTGVQATGVVGSVTVSTVARVDVSVPVTGVAATGSIGTATVTGKASTTVTGVQATGAVGTVTTVAGTGASVPDHRRPATGVGRNGYGKRQGCCHRHRCPGCRQRRHGHSCCRDGSDSSGHRRCRSRRSRHRHHHRQSQYPAQRRCGDGAVGGVSVVAGGSISTTVTGVQATGSGRYRDSRQQVQHPGHRRVGCWCGRHRDCRHGRSRRRPHQRLERIRMGRQASQGVERQHMAAETGQALERLGMGMKPGHRQARPALMSVDNPYYSADHPESRDNPRVVEAVVNLREWSVATLAAHGVLDADQVAAAFRFRNAWETVQGARQASIGFSEWIDAGCRAAGFQRAPHGRCGHTQAVSTAAWRAWLSPGGQVCGDGHHIRDLYPTRRARDTATDLLRIHLSDLAALWH